MTRELKNGRKEENSREELDEDEMGDGEMGDGEMSKRYQKIKNQRTGKTKKRKRQRKRKGKGKNTEEREKGAKCPTGPTVPQPGTINEHGHGHKVWMDGSKSVIDCYHDLLKNTLPVGTLHRCTKK